MMHASAGRLPSRYAPREPVAVRKPSPVQRSAEVRDAPAAYVTIRQREVDHVFAGVDWLSAGLMHIQRGVKMLRYGDDTVEVAAGELVWVAPGTRVDIRNVPHEGEYRAEGLLIAAELLAETKPTGAAELARLRRIDAGEHPHLLEAYRRCIEALTGRFPPDVVRCRVRELVAWMAELRVEMTTPVNARLRVKRLVSSDPARGWKLRDVAKALAMSEDTLHRRLTRERTSFQKVLTEVRMDHAAALLWGTELPLGQIALDVGYTSASRFATRFHERFGLLPSRLRAMR